MSLDKLILGFDRALRTVFVPARATRKSPAEEAHVPHLSEKERLHVIGLMRVNHSGEVCAQALYQGQSLVSRNLRIKAELMHAAEEETDHLAWTEGRIRALGGRTSLLNPLWYVGSLSLGVAAGLLGDKWNLGFVAETERQVEAHLDRHLDSLPDADDCSRKIVEQMRNDEIEHAKMAVHLGAAELPLPVRQAMKAVAKIMTVSAYRI